MTERADMPWFAVGLLTVGALAWTLPNVARIPGVLPLVSVLALCQAIRLAGRWTRLRWWLVPFAASVVIGWLLLWNAETAVRHVAGASLGVLFMLAIPEMTGDRNRLSTALTVYLVLAFAMLLVGLAAVDIEDMSPARQAIFRAVQANPFGWLPELRLGLEGAKVGGVVNPNALSAAALLVGPTGLAMLTLTSGVADIRLQKILGFAVTGLAAFIIAICFSRSAWVALWLSLAVVLVVGTRSVAWRAVLVSLVVGPLLASVFVVGALQRSMFSDITDDFWKSVHGRKAVFAAGLDQIRQSPWVGIGLNKFRHVYRGADPSVEIAHAHNVFIQTALDIGVIGLLAYCGLLGYVWRRAYEVWSGQPSLARSVAAGGALSVLAVTLFGLTDAVALGARIGTFQWASAGLVLAAWRVNFEGQKNERA